MNDELEYRVRELERLVANLIRVATIVAVDPAAARASVRFGAGVNRIETAMLPWLTQRAGNDRTWWAPSVGEQVVLFSPSGDLAQGVILPAVYAAAAPAPASSPDVHRTLYASGFVIEHDNAAKRTVLNAWDEGGTIELRAMNVVIKTGDGGFFHLDHAGYAERITHVGGATYETDTWKTGAVVTGNPDQGHSPPEVEA